MKEKTEKTAAKKVRMNQRMKERVQRIDNQTYWYLIQLLDLEVDEAKKELPRNTKFLKKCFRLPRRYLKSMGTMYAACTFPHRKLAGSTFARLLNAGVKAAAVRMNLWKRNGFFPVSKMPLRLAG